MILLQLGQRAVFACGFAKSDQRNIRGDELTALRELATELLGYNEEELAQASKADALIEVMDE